MYKVWPDGRDESTDQADGARGKGETKPMSRAYIVSRHLDCHRLIELTCSTPANLSSTDDTRPDGCAPLICSRFDGRSISFHPFHVLLNDWGSVSLLAVVTSR